MLTKPVSRTAFVIAKAAVHSVFLAILVVLGTYSPAALTTQPASLAAGKDAAVLWPVLTSVLLAAAFVALAALAFRRKDL